MTLPQEPDGYYTVNVTDSTTSPATTQQISYAIVAPYDLPADSPFGSNTHVLPSGLSTLDAKMGNTWARMDIDWGAVEQTRGQYSFTDYDYPMWELTQSGIHPLVILDYRNSLYDNGKTPYNAVGYTAFANRAPTSDIVTRSKSQNA